MSEFKYIYGESLQHWGKGKESKDHKYTAREWVKGKWQYVYDTANKAKDKVSNTIGIEQRKNYKNAELKASRDRLNAYKANKAYNDNRYTDSEYHHDLQKRGYTNKDREWDREYTERQIKDLYDFGNKSENKKQFDDTRSAPKSASNFRYFDAKLHADTARKERAEQLTKQSIDSYKQVEISKLEYDKTLLGKIKKGFDIIDNVTDIYIDPAYKNDEYMKTKLKEYIDNKKAYDDDAIIAIENLNKIINDYDENSRIVKIARRTINNITNNMTKESDLKVINSRDYWNGNEVARAIDLDRWLKRYFTKEEIEKSKKVKQKEA